jgi:hypothetical protein
MPQTLQDAVTVTRRLGLQYIWVDCLCIVQDESEDLVTELAKMPDIYGHAVLAASATTFHEGFLHESEYTYCFELEFPYGPVR